MISLLRDLQNPEENRDGMDRDSDVLRVEASSARFHECQEVGAERTAQEYL